MQTARWKYGSKMALAVGCSCLLLFFFEYNHWVVSDRSGVVALIAIRRVETVVRIRLY